MRRLLPILVLAFAANAEIVLDQEQPLIEPAHGLQALGGITEQKIAQTVTAGLSGRLVEVHVPAACGNGEVILEIHRLAADGTPIGPGLALELLRAGDFARTTDPPVFHRFVIDPAPRFEAGERFSIMLRDKTGECAMWPGPKGDSYPRGEGWSINNTPPTDAWTRNSDRPYPFDDWPFKTFVDTTPEPPPPPPPPPPPRSAGPCTVTGFGPIPFIPAWLPVCRCLQDAGLRETRCALFHPDFFLYRRVPLPIDPGKPYEVLWTLVPLGPIKGVVEVSEPLGLKGPLTFFVDQVPRGESLTLGYDADPLQAGTVKVETTILVTRPGLEPEKGAIRTVIEAGVKPK